MCAIVNRYSLTKTRKEKNKQNRMKNDISLHKLLAPRYGKNGLLFIIYSATDKNY